MWSQNGTPTAEGLKDSLSSCVFLDHLQTNHDQKKLYTYYFSHHRVLFFPEFPLLGELLPHELSVAVAAHHEHSLDTLGMAHSVDGLYSVIDRHAHQGSGNVLTTKISWNGETVGGHLNSSKLYLRTKNLDLDFFSYIWLKSALILSSQLKSAEKERNMADNFILVWY